MSTSDIYFKDGRLALTAPESIVAKLAAAALYAALALGVFVAFLSDVPGLWYSGALALFFLGDRALRAGRGERSIAELSGRKGANAADAFTPAAFKVLERAYRKARIVQHDFHLLLLQELAERRDVRTMLRRMGVRREAFSEKLAALTAASRATYTRPYLLEEAAVLGKGAFAAARELEERYIEPRTIFAALAAREGSAAEELFRVLNIHPSDVRDAVIFGRYAPVLYWIRNVPEALGGFAPHITPRRHRVMNRAWTARPTPALDRYGRDLTDAARRQKTGFLVGHEKELSRTLDALSKPGRPNVLLVGEAGTGKATLVRHLAFLMARDRVPPFLFDKRLVELNLGALMADAPLETVTARMQEAAREIMRAENVVLFIPDIHALFKTTREGVVSPIELFIPILRHARVPVIGETSPREFRKFVEPRADFMEQVETVRVEELDETAARRLLIYLALILERQFRCIVTLRAIRQAVALAARYLRPKPLPGSAMDVLREACVRAAREKTRMVDEAFVAQVVENMSEVPVRAARGAEAVQLLHLEKLIHEKLVDQEEAVAAVSRALREYRSGLARQGGPIASFLFVGPTGVGKTELAKILAEIQFGSREEMHRFDMSEYQDPKSTFRLIGTPDGATTGDLTDAVRTHPYRVVLLDEFEKAHPDVLNLFLQVFDDGRLTDSMGRTADFRHAVVIATSNALSDFVQGEIEAGRSAAMIAETLKKRLAHYFRPELINRFSDVIVFRALRREDTEAIARLMAREVAETLRTEHGITLTFADEAICELARRGYDPVFGARPLRNVISKEVRGRLAEMVLREEFGRGAKVELGFESGELVFR